ncbi:hypothetical protein [Kibdelosporangium phytohabitans]|uniref:hypothetical protein n=1 Tax=Kibdelosporangium phytohabitans TaxID=860235 RepID=UPI00146FF6A1
MSRSELIVADSIWIVVSRPPSSRLTTATVHASTEKPPSSRCARTISPSRPCPGSRRSAATSPAA